jgi:hypothetical protein
MVKRSTVSRTAVVCNGRGDQGGHCCWIDGVVCQFLFTDRGGTPRCGIWDEMSDSTEWAAAPVGLMFARKYPGMTCHDWPQNIPELMEREPEMGPFALCCWGRGNS